MGVVKNPGGKSKMAPRESSDESSVRNTTLDQQGCELCSCSVLSFFYSIGDKNWRSRSFYLMCVMQLSLGYWIPSARQAFVGGFLTDPTSLSELLCGVGTVLFSCLPAVNHPQHLSTGSPQYLRDPLGWEYLKKALVQLPILVPLTPGNSLRSMLPRCESSFATPSLHTFPRWSCQSLCL